jgi:two-component system sensor histidine kinase HydH
MNRERPTLKIGTLGILIVVTVLFHYGVLYDSGTPLGHFFHAIHRRLCYVPIILAGIWFGLRGGLAASALISLVVLPLAVKSAGRDVHALTTELAEILFYLGLGVITGTLTDLQRRERDKKEELARELDRTSRLSELGEMAAGIAHEIKNPLGSIRGAAEILGDEIGPGHEKREFVDIISRESKRLEGVTQAFLGYARMPSDRLVPTDVVPLLSSVVKQSSLEKDEISPHIDYDPPDQPIRAPIDEERIRQVFLNLIRNAIQALENGGQAVEIRARPDVRTDRDPGRRFVEVTVRDDGRGIPAEDLERVFVPFYTTKPKGTGLGLSLSFKIVEAHGGFLSLESEEGRGTTARVLLPMTEDR